MTAEVLGLQMQVSVFAIRACPPPEQLQQVLKGLVEFIGMTTGGLEPQIWHYPYAGLGGEGETLVLPFMTAQPLMESLSLGVGAIAGDTWRDHGGSFIIVASCRPYSVQAICTYLGREAGIVVDFGEAPVVRLSAKQTEKK